MIDPPLLSLSLAGLRHEPGAPWSAGPRAAIEWAAALGYRLVHVDATMPGLRPRELDRSARRDAAALLRRLGIGCSGVDLLIPPQDFADPARSERALSAALSSIELAADLVVLTGAGTARLCVELPERVPDGPLDRLRDRALVCGVLVADLAWPPRQRSEAEDPIGVAIDPAAALIARGDPVAAAARAGRALHAARFTDADSAGRTIPGEGRLDRLAYIVALNTAGYRAPVIADLRGLPDQAGGARRALQSWSGSEVG